MNYVGFTDLYSALEWAYQNMQYIQGGMFSTQIAGVGIVQIWRAPKEWRKTWSWEWTA